jgi:ribonuclease PH
MSYQRTDNRTDDQIRTTKITPNISPYAEGSALIEVGGTKVICTASVEDRVPMFMRTQRETQRGPSGRTQEIQRLIGRSLRAVVDQKLLGERQIYLDCDVIQADGGTRCASITGAYVALALACRKLLKQGTIKTSPIISEVAAVSVGIIEGTPILDLAYTEDSNADVDMNVVCTGLGRFIELQGTAEREPFSREQMDEMLVLADIGVNKLFEIQRNVLSI